MGDLQTHATPCNALFITRNEQVNGSSPLVGSLYFTCKTHKNVTAPNLLLGIWQQ
jgi:hypothetical protein